MTVDNGSTISTADHERSEARQRTFWVGIALVLVVAFSGISFAMLRWMKTPPSTAIVAVLGLALVAILLAPLLFEISELSVGKSGISAKIRTVEQKVEAASQRIDNLRDEILLQLAGQYGVETYRRRSEGYRNLWSMLEPFAVYFRQEPVTYESLSQLGRALRHWYFEYGMFLSETGRDRYFFLQDILQVLALRKEEAADELSGQDPLLYAETDLRDRELFALLSKARPDKKWKQQLYDYFTPETTADPNFIKQLAESRDKHFALVRCAASALRTQMAKDLQSRETLDSEWKQSLK
jgi:hypothetical protein